MKWDLGRIFKRKKYGRVAPLIVIEDRAPWRRSRSFSVLSFFRCLIVPDEDWVGLELRVYFTIFITSYGYCVSWLYYFCFIEEWMIGFAETDVRANINFYFVIFLKPPLFSLFICHTISISIFVKNSIFHPFCGFNCKIDSF